jgi:GNAT superfamily N-acetyltransferase
MNVVIDRVNPTEHELMSHLFNQVFRPERSPESFARRLRNRLNTCFLVARVETQAVGFFVGMELKPTVYFGWLCGVLPDARRMGVATQLIHAAMDYARTEGYQWMRFECGNRQRAMLHFGITAGYDIVGVRWDPDRQENLIILERSLTESHMA